MQTSSCCRCAPSTPWVITIAAGALLATIGAVAITAMIRGNFGSVRLAFLKVAHKMQAPSLVLPIFIASVGATALIAGLLGLSHQRFCKA